MTEDVRRHHHWLPMVPAAISALLLLTGCGSLGRFAVDRDPSPASRVALDVSAGEEAVPAGFARLPDTAPPATGAGDESTPTIRIDATATEIARLADRAIPPTDPAPESMPLPASLADDTPAGDPALPRSPAVEAETTGAPAALALQARPLGEDEDFEPYDPWVSFNERVFEFNREIDRIVLKPVATAYDRVVPNRLQMMIANGFDNLRSIPRMVNSALQGKFDGALREFGRLLINTTIGIGGLFDMAQQEWNIRRSEEDFGQTLGVWGVGPGPYLVLPLMPPMTVRDGIGRAVDGFLDPLNYLLPFFWERLTVRVGENVNDRSLNLELYEGFEETVIDMYSAVRHVYLQRRGRMVLE